MKSRKTEDIRKTIMVVDDDESIRSLIQTNLENDYTIIPMKDGQEALIHLIFFILGDHPRVTLSSLK